MYGTYVSSRMTSTTVYLTEEQQARLDAVRAATRRPKASIIREGINLALDRHGAPASPEGEREAHTLQCDCELCLNGGDECPQ